jgi:hypothetical protein
MRHRIRSQRAYNLDLVDDSHCGNKRLAIRIQLKVYPKAIVDIAIGNGR